MAWIGVAGPGVVGAASGIVKGGGERGGERSRRRETVGRRASVARAGFRAATGTATRITPATSISPATGICIGAETTTWGHARVAARVCACGAQGVCPVAVWIRAPAAAWNGPTGHSQVQTRLVSRDAALARLRIQVAAPVRPSAIRGVQADVPVRPRAASHPRVRARVPARVTATRRPRVYARVPARVSARHPRVATGAWVTASGGIARARRAARPRVTVPARVAARTQAVRRVMSEARVTVPARIGGATVQARTIVQPRITGQPRLTSQPGITGQPRVTAVRAVHTARFHRMTLVLPPGTLVCGPPASGTVPPVPAAVTAVVAIGDPAGVTGGSTVRVEVGVTGGDGSTPARVHGGLRTAVAHTPLTPPLARRRYRPEITPSWSTSAGPATWSARPVPLVYLQEAAWPARTS
jgi:hypothetical protein